MPFWWRGSIPRQGDRSPSRPPDRLFQPAVVDRGGVRGPGIEARGVGFAGVNLYVQMGRGRDFAWLATSAGADNVDQWVVKLCEPDGGQAHPSSQGGGDLYKSATPWSP